MIHWLQNKVGSQSEKRPLDRHLGHPLHPQGHPSHPLNHHQPHQQGSLLTRHLGHYYAITFYIGKIYLKNIDTWVFYLIRNKVDQRKRIPNSKALAIAFSCISALAFDLIVASLLGSPFLHSFSLTKTNSELARPIFSKAIAWSIASFSAKKVATCP